MNKIKALLVAINAKYIHKVLAPWCIKAFCDAHAPRCEVAVYESNINEPIGDIVESIYKLSPDIIGISTYIWNVDYTKKIADTIKKILPSCIIVLGGPEVSFELSLDDYPTVDYLIQGAGEAAFLKLTNSIAAGLAPPKCIIKDEGLIFNDFPSPFTAEYFCSSQTDTGASINNQLVYYESSRGCPFHCAYCLSSVTHGVQELPLERVKEELSLLLSHGAACIKFVDRTFNANKGRMAAILEYIYSLDTACTFHFEVAGDLFDKRLLDIIAAMPINRVQFEVGIQSVNPPTLAAVSRKTNIKAALENISRITTMNNCHVHVDLIAGLPYETLETSAAAVNRCLAARPHMLQLGFLKLLKGSQLRKHSEKLDYIYTDYAPYEVLKSNAMSMDKLLQLKDIERVIDKFYNSGMFANSLQYAAVKLFDTEYDLFRVLGEYCKGVGNIKVSLKNAYSILLEFLKHYGDKDEAEHYIKLDCLTFDTKGMLPDGIESLRDRAVEAQLKNTLEYKGKNIRVEYFAYDNKKRLFIYKDKHPISKIYPVKELE
ncbi:MAG: DUF4080 domain-containing protein [Clostridiales bacterium]|nr:DUF4080 domain-containing protein [Clostridiales bacterium]